MQELRAFLQRAGADTPEVLAILRENEVDVSALHCFNDADFEEIGLPNLVTQAAAASGAAGGGGLQQQEHEPEPAVVFRSGSGRMLTAHEVEARQQQQQEQGATPSRPPLPAGFIKAPGASGAGSQYARVAKMAHEIEGRAPATDSGTPPATPPGAQTFPSNYGAEIRRSGSGRMLMAHELEQQQRLQQQQQQQQQHQTPTSTSADPAVVFRSGGSSSAGPPRMRMAHEIEAGLSAVPTIVPPLHAQWAPPEKTGTTHSDGIPVSPGGGATLAFGSFPPSMMNSPMGASANSWAPPTPPAGAGASNNGNAGCPVAATSEPEPEPARSNRRSSTNGGGRQTTAKKSNTPKGHHGTGNGGGVSGGWHQQGQAGKGANTSVGTGGVTQRAANTGHVGFAFMCNDKTEKECLDKMLFGSPANLIREMQGCVAIQLRTCLVHLATLCWRCPALD